MAFAVCDALLTMASVGQCEANVTNIPILVLQLLQNLDPHIRDGHGEAIVKSHAAQMDRNAKTRHTRYVFCDSNAFWVQRVQHVIGKHHVHHRFLVNIVTEIFMVTARESPVVC